MQCHCLSPRRVLGRVRRIEENRMVPIQEDQQEHTMIQMRDGAVDGEELMVPRVPRLPPEPSARQIAEHELTGHGVYRSWGQNCVESRGRAPLTLHERKESCQTLASTMASLVVTEKMCCRSCLSNAQTVQTDAWQQQLLKRRARLHSSRVWGSRESW